MTAERIDWPALAEPVARALMGDPNPEHSGPKEWRYGSRGSLSVDLATGRWFDHQEGVGGGLLELIARHAGGGKAEALAWLRDRGFLEAAPPARATKRGPGRILAAYPYRDERGELLFEVVRHEPKDFRQRRPDGRGGWVYALKGVRRVLYRLPELVAAPPGAVVFVVEGEKAADALAARGLVATCSPGGAGKWRDPYADALRGRECVILADNDDPGRAHAAAVLASLRRADVAAAVLALEGLPHKGDPFDWLAAGGDEAELVELAGEALDRAAEGDPAPEPEASPWFAASALAGLPVAPRLWHVADLIPSGNVTLLNGDGGTGKSLLALHLAVATALHRPWLHRETREGGAVYLSAEDDRAELHRRLADICAAEGADLADLGRLHLRSLAGAEALLAVPDPRSRLLVATPLLAELDDFLATVRPALLVLDTLADLFGGDENHRAEARAFIGMLRGLAMRHGCAVLLLAHPSVAGMANGSGASGSTAWNASVRSRLYLERLAEGGFEADPDARRLKTVKANYGRSGGEILLHWREGAFEADAAEAGLDRMATSAKSQRVFMRLLRQFADEGRTVNHAGGPQYAPGVFADHPGAEGVTKPALLAAMNALLQRGAIKIETVGPPSRRTTKLVVAGAEA